MSEHAKITGKKLPAAAVCDRYGITRRTLGRWMVDPEMGFPASLTLNNRHYFDGDELLEYERRAVAARGKAA